jgi:hypothetical protein
LERRADQFSSSRSTGILPVVEKHGQDARATPSAGTQFEQLTGPDRSIKRRFVQIPCEAAGGIMAAWTSRGHLACFV